MCTTWRVCACADQRFFFDFQLFNRGAELFSKGAAPEGYRWAKQELFSRMDQNFFQIIMAEPTWGSQTHLFRRGWQDIHGQRGRGGHPGVGVHDIVTNGDTANKFRGSCLGFCFFNSFSGFSSLGPFLFLLLHHASGVFQQATKFDELGARVRRTSELPHAQLKYTHSL